MRVLSLCDLSGVAVRPWAEAGAECVCLDLQHPPNDRFIGNTHYVRRDVKEWRPNSKYNFCFAFPPCTHLAVSGARWMKGKGLRLLAEAIEIVAACAEICESLGCPYLIENPVSTLATYWRKPDYSFHPCDYARYLPEPEQAEEAYTKKTCLWVGGGFRMPEPKPVKPVLGSKMHLLPPSEDRANLRSKTPRGFALAVFEANYPHLKGGDN